MKLSAILAPLLDSKADHETIRAVMLAFEAAQTDALEQRRRADAERQSRKRERDLSRDITLRHSDGALTGAGDVRVEETNSTQKIEPLKEVRKKVARATRLSSDWSLPDDWRDDGRKAGLSEAAIDREAQAIRDWSLSSPNGAKLDWHAAWRGWCRRAADSPQNQRAGPPAQRRGIGGVFDDLEGFLSNGQTNGSGDDEAPQGVVLSLPYRAAQR